MFIRIAATEYPDPFTVAIADVEPQWAVDEHDPPPAKFRTTVCSGQWMWHAAPRPTIRDFYRYFAITRRWNSTGRAAAIFATAKEHRDHYNRCNP